MSLDDLERALALIRTNPPRSRFAGPRDPATVDAAEAALGVAFPPTYRRFLLELGAGHVGGNEFYGVINTEFSGRPPDAIGTTLDGRRDAALPEHYVIVSDTGYGDWYVLDTTGAPEREGPVVIFMPGVPAEDAPPPEHVADDFGAFIAEKLSQALD